MVGIKQAVANAVEYIEDLFKEEECGGLRLEEAELSEDESYWFITLSFLRKLSADEEASPFAKLMGTTTIPKLKRDYKTVKIGAQDGHVWAVKIRTP